VRRSQPIEFSDNSSRLPASVRQQGSRTTSRTTITDGMYFLRTCRGRWRPISRPVPYVTFYSHNVLCHLIIHLSLNLLLVSKHPTLLSLPVLFDSVILSLQAILCMWQTSESIVEKHRQLKIDIVSATATPFLL
jgi:hypothetical protein